MKIEAEKEYTLHHALTVDMGEDVKVQKFKTQEGLKKFIASIQDDGSIWLLGAESQYSELYISENLRVIRYCLNDLIKTSIVLFIHRYETFEDAYKIALAMKEGHHRCYKGDNDSLIYPN